MQIYYITSVLFQNYMVELPLGIHFLDQSLDIFHHSSIQCKNSLIDLLMSFVMGRAYVDNLAFFFNLYCHFPSSGLICPAMGVGLFHSAT